MTQTKGLLVRPKRGHAKPFALLAVAEKWAEKLAAQGRGPVEIVSLYTGDVVRVVGGEG